MKNLPKPTATVPEGTPVLISRRDAAEILKVSIETLKRWGKAGHLTDIRCGPRLIRYDLAEIQALAGGGKGTRAAMDLKGRADRVGPVRMEAAMAMAALVARADRCAAAGMVAAVLELQAARLDDSMLWTRPYAHHEHVWLEEAAARRAMVLAVVEQWEKGQG